MATARPASTQASAASTPAPPALEITATRLPAGTGCSASSTAASSSSPKLVVAMTPACSNRACRVISGAAAAAVCEAAARWPGAERPACTVSTGMCWLTRAAVRPNLRGLPNDSRYSTASWVVPSSAHHCSMSLPDTSTLSPTEANEEMPMPSREKCSSRATPTPPDCTTSPARPRRGWWTAKVASRPRPGTATPKQFGPTSRMPQRRPASSRLADWAASSPELITTTERVPRLPSSWVTSTTPAAGTVMTARSGASGSAAAEGTLVTPGMCSSCGLTAYSAPAYPASRMFIRIDRPMEPGRCPAPTTATERGASSGSRLATSAVCSRPATASR